MNYLIELAFLGKNYHGWQIQKNAATVQGVVLDCLKKLWNIEELQGCSRTDAGVNANHYFANFQTNLNLPIDKIPIALNSILPLDIRCLSCKTVADDFNARTNAKGKIYVYTIDTSQIQLPINAMFSLHFPHELNIKNMKKAAKLLIGEKDFSSFCNAGDQNENKIREIYDIKIKRKGNFITIHIHGNAFLYNMCRIIAGFLVYCGQKGFNKETILEIINAKSRQSNPALTLPPNGLALNKVYY